MRLFCKSALVAVLLAAASGCVGPDKSSHTETWKRTENCALILPLIEGLQKEVKKLRAENEMLRAQLEALRPGPVAAFSASPDEKEKKILQVKSHRLDWKSYDGTGDPLKAEYYLDGLRLGTGEKGVAKLKRLIAKMPEGSWVKIIPYYEGKRPYPFDEHELNEYCEKYGVVLGIPKAK